MDEVSTPIKTFKLATRTRTQGCVQDSAPFGFPMIRLEGM